MIQVKPNYCSCIKDVLINNVVFTTGVLVMEFENVYRREFQIDNMIRFNKLIRLKEDGVFSITNYEYLKEIRHKNRLVMSEE